ncbi:MAG: Mut7-C RNAse domain-containing protein [Deltaproteobacteria bacterium]|nr:Mut7-C RNAse domain-containing protein [Deltaproteobacteria bacterium]
MNMKFIVDRTLGKLAGKLRALGFDTRYWEGGRLEEAVQAAAAEERVLLTRSRRLPSGADRVFPVQANDPWEQLREVLSRLRLELREEQFFSRCLRCNALLRQVSKEEVEGRVPDFIFRTYDLFHLCPRCQRVFWPGTHLNRLRADLEKQLTNQDECLSYKRL